jgi:4-hydroxy-tetrahydrodipicolinate reductase
MNIALIGYGKMGREIEAAARETGDTVVEIFDIDRPADAASLAKADVCIEFSTPDAANAAASSCSRAISRACSRRTRRRADS